jgi:exodeoxyribonuclease VII large subunit
MNDRQLSLFELQQQVKSRLDEAFALPVWVKAEISEMTTNRSGHCYLDLVETEPGTDAVIARSRATIWSYTFRMLKPYFETTTGQAFTQGIKILVQAKIEYHEIFGFSLNIRDIDPVYTLGDLARQRKEIILRLQQDGVYEMNKELTLPLVAQRIAIISSPTAAGLQDFVDQLHRNPHGFVFYAKLFPSLMQGTEAPRSIMNALELIYACEEMFDVVVIIRGGGAQLDLACFDHYELASYVAQFPLPVITGIGHDKDDSVVDLVAHTRMKTPTAVAEFLIGGALQFEQRIKELENNFINLVNNQLEENNEILADAANQLNLLVNEILSKQANKLEILNVQLKNQAGTYLKNQQTELQKRTVEVRNMTTHFVTKQNHLIQQAKLEIAYSFRKQILKNATRLTHFNELLNDRITVMIRHEKKNIDRMEEKCRLVNPQNILKRGYSLTMANGKILKSVGQVNPGDQLRTRLSDGFIESTASKIENDK